MFAPLVVCDLNSSKTEGECQAAFASFRSGNSGFVCGKDDPVGGDGAASDAAGRPRRGRKDPGGMLRHDGAMHDGDRSARRSVTVRLVGDFHAMLW